VTALWKTLDWLFGATSFGGVGLLALLGLLLSLLLLLPKGGRAKLRLPVALLVVHLALVALRGALADGTHASRPLALLAVFLLLVALARCAFLLIVDSVLGARLGRPLPRIFRDIIQGVIYAAVAFLTLDAAGVEPGSLLTTSALLTAVVGLSLQDTLGNLFAGLSIQAQRPFEVGDWINVDNDAKLVGQVAEINWRATKVITNDEVELIIPNGMLSKASIRNFTKPTPISRRMVEVSCAYEVPPGRVHEVILASLDGVPEVLAEPAPSILTASFGDSGVSYQVRFFITNFQRRDVIESSVRDRIWYALKRASISIPFPIRDVRMAPTGEAAASVRPQDQLGERVGVLRGVDLLALLPSDALYRLAAQIESRLYAPNEFVIRQGEAGEEMFIVVRGQARVRVGRAGGSSAELTKLGPGNFFGEMSLMTGERRTATVQAASECELLVVRKQVLLQFLQASPQLADRISDLLTERQEQLDEHIASRAARSKPGHEERRGVLLSRIRHFFAL
jgi:small-conductance mechanosensitive channel/CRP-like cAMP-binding protein